MKALLKSSAVAAVLLLGATGCADMTPSQKGTAAGAAIGGVAGSVLTNGSALGTVGGAAVGGVVGHEVGEDRERKGRR
jgi:osmotically inducible lipoprotein OsmB